MTIFCLNLILKTTIYKQYHTANLISTEGCAVEFVHIFPQNAEDPRRWIGGLIQSFEVAPMQNLHNHPIGHSLNYKLPVKVISDITKHCKTILI